MADPLTMLAGSIASASRDSPPADADRCATQAFLIVLEGGIPGELLRLDPGGTRLGRSTENDIVLPDPGISRQHAYLWFTELQVAQLTDRGSSNGTFVNSEPLERGHTATLVPGDTIRFGPHFVVRFNVLDAHAERLQRSLFERAVTDGMTRLYNRMFFLTNADFKICRNSSGDQGLAIMMIDVDRFKAVNDTYGHPAGDSVLRGIAQILIQSSRPNDLVSRYGGEEFIAAFNVPNLQRSILIAERIRHNVQKHPFLLEDPTLHETHAQEGPASALESPLATTLRCTISIGLAYAPPGYKGQLTDLIAAADQCLYQAKTDGRNRVSCTAMPPSPER